MLTVIVFLIILSVLVLVHEAGHFFVARFFGVKVEEFGFGFPPKLLAKKSSKSGVVYSLNWIPLGGFVRIKGEMGETADDEDSFSHKKIWQRSMIICAGVVMNFVLTVFLFTIGFTFGFPQIIDQNLPSFSNVRDYKLQVTEVKENYPAAKVEIKLGDQILGYRETTGELVKFANLTEFLNYLDTHKNQIITLDLKREGNLISKEVTPEILSETGRAGLGIKVMESGLVSYPFYRAPWEALKTSVSLVKEIFVALAHIFYNLIVSQKVGMEVAGPVGVAVLTGEVVRLGFWYIIYFAAMLSLNLAIVNILPIPALDGGKLFFLILEKIRQKPINQKIEGTIHTVGFFLLIALVLVVTVKDVSQFGDVFRALWQKVIN